MDIDTIGMSDFDPGWISRTVMPWDEQTPLAVSRSLLPLSLSAQEPMATLSEWQGIAAPGLLGGGQTPETIRRLRRWMAVGIPPPSNASESGSRPNWLQYAYRMNRRVRRQPSNLFASELADEGGSAGQEREQIESQSFDQALPFPSIGENESGLVDLLGSFMPSNELATTLDYSTLALSQPNDTLRRLGIAPHDLLVASPSQAGETGEANSIAARHESMPSSTASLAGDVARLYRVANRAADTRLERASDELRLEYPENVERVPRQPATESLASAVQPSAVQNMNLVPSQFTRAVTSAQTFASALAGNLSVLASRHVEGEPRRETGSSSAEEYGQHTPAEFVTLRPTLGERPGQVQNADIHPAESSIVLSNATSGEQNGSGASPSLDIPAQVEAEQAPAAGSAPLESPAFTLLQPLRSLLSPDTRVPMRTLRPSTALALAQAPLTVSEAGRLAMMIQSAANASSDRLASAPGDLVHSISGTTGASAFSHDLQSEFRTDHILAPARSNAAQETDSIREFGQANPPLNSAPPQMTYSAAPTPPAMQVRRAASEPASGVRTNDNITNVPIHGESQALGTSNAATSLPSGANEHASPPSNVATGGLVAGALEQSHPSPDINALARQVYAILKDRLRAERERHDIYSR